MLLPTSTEITTKGGQNEGYSSDPQDLWPFRLPLQELGQPAKRQGDSPIQPQPTAQGQGGCCSGEDAIAQQVNNLNKPIHNIERLTVCALDC